MATRVKVTLVSALFATALVAGCGSGKTDKAGTQVAAKVNAEEITIHQVNNALARVPNVTPETAEKAKREILDRLIDQELAKQHAIDMKLDRSPGVVQSIEAARNEILARAYLDQIAAGQPKATAEEARKYYAEHPELFANRRIFDLEEIALKPSEALKHELRDQVSRTRNMQDLAAWLKSRGIQFTANRGVRAAEQIPLEMLSDLQVMKTGEIRVMEAMGRVYVFRVIATKASPVMEATALPLIEKFLSNQRSAEAVVTEIKHLKERANIVYMGEFAKAPAISDEKPAVEAPASETKPLAPHVEKGVRGLN